MPTSFFKESKLSEEISREKMKQAIDLISIADLVIIIGTTGFRCNEYLSRIKDEARLIQINPSETQFDGLVDLNIRANGSDALDAVING